MRWLFVMKMLFLCVVDGVRNDVRDMLVGEAIGNLAATADTFHEISAAQDPQVLTDERLRQSE